MDAIIGTPGPDLKCHFLKKLLGHSARLMRLDPLFEIKLDLAAKGSRKSAASLYGQLKAAILDGRLGAGSKLPVTRQSESFFGVSRNTAAEVYERLSSEGFVATRRGSGTYVMEGHAREQHRSAAVPKQVRDPRLNAFWLRPDITAALDFWWDEPSESPGASRASPIDFRPALIDSRLFPFDVFRQVSVKQLRRLENKPASYKSPQGNQGNYHLRYAITRHIGVTRAVVCQSEDVLVTAGAQQAFDVLARVLVTPGETTVAIEDPGYPPMRVAYAAAGAKVVPVAVDEEGLRVDLLPADARVICVCPSHQFPLGISMSPRRRKALIEFARKHGAVIIEDDYDGEFRYDGSPLQALRSAGAQDVVFYVGTFSKCMLPALRLGFIVAPDWAMRTLIAAKNSLDWHCPTPLQMGVARFIADGHLQRHVRKLRGIYQERRQLILDLLRRDFGTWLTPIPSCYGMHIAAAAAKPLALDGIAQTLLRSNVKLHSLSRYYLGAQAVEGLIFGYGTVDLPEIRRGFAALRAAFK
jgi:GntR family transcriptional regulator / MocR family aminotransferase